MELPKPISFDWNEGNRDKNWEKHRVNFQECEQVFFDDRLKTFYNAAHSQTEDRFVALGTTNKARKLYVIFTIRNEKVRIISARDMSKKERRLYEEYEKD